MKEKLPLIVAVLFGVIAFFGISQYLKKQEKVIPQVEILVVANDMAKGETIDDEDLTTLRTDRALTSRLTGIYYPNQRNLLVDQVLAKDMKRGEPILESSVALPESGPRFDRFSRKLSPGERAISLPIDNAGAVAEFIMVDDRVDILANIQVPETVTRSFTIPNQGVQEVTETTYEPTTLFLFENVRVLAVGDMYQEPVPGERLGGGGSVTISVTPREAQILAWAMRNGSGGGAGSGVTFTMLLRSQQDKGMVYPRELVTYEDVLDLTKIQELQQFRLEQEGMQTEVYQGGVPANQ